MLAGMSHGASGIMLALGKLYRLTGSAVFRSAVESALRYEASVYSPDAKNWPDLRKRPLTSANFGPHWCYGAARIGLARLCLLQILDEAFLLQEVETALNAVQDSYPLPTDDLCCGNFGRVDFLLSSGHAMKNGTLIKRAKSLAESFHLQACNSGDFRWKAGTYKQNPSFHTGISGVGYQLLRTLRGPKFPSILAWEEVTEDRGDR